MQQNTQLMPLHAINRIMLNNIIFDKRSLRRAKTLDHRRSSIKNTKYGTNKFVMVNSLADTSAQSILRGEKRVPTNKCSQ